MDSTILSMWYKCHIHTTNSGLIIEFILHASNLLEALWTNSLVELSASFYRPSLYKTQIPPYSYRDHSYMFIQLHKGETQLKLITLSEAF